MLVFMSMSCFSEIDHKEVEADQREAETTQWSEGNGYWLLLVYVEIFPDLDHNSCFPQVIAC